jgi:hypothetical protein
MDILIASILITRFHCIVLLAQLHYCPGFRDFAGAVTAINEATLQQSLVVGTGADEQRPLERLREIRDERSHAALQRAGRASVVTLRMLAAA